MRHFTVLVVLFSVCSWCDHAGSERVLHRLKRQNREYHLRL